LDRSAWEQERVVPLDDDGADDDTDTPPDGTKEQQAGTEGGDPVLGPGGGMPSSRIRRSRWRMESRYAELLVASSEFPFCAWDATTYVCVVVVDTAVGI
jgi:hypothetical protein